jgi:hypothetical protein
MNEAVDQMAGQEPLLLADINNNLTEEEELVLFDFFDTKLSMLNQANQVTLQLDPLEF